MTSQTLLACLHRFVTFHRNQPTATSVGNGCVDVQHSLLPNVRASWSWGMRAALVRDQTREEAQSLVDEFASATGCAMLLVALVDACSTEDEDSTIEHRITWIKCDGEVYKVHAALFQRDASIGYPVRFDKSSFAVDAEMLRRFVSKERQLWLPGREHVKAYQQLVGLRSADQGTLRRMVNMGKGRVMETRVFSHLVSLTREELYRQLCNPLIVPRLF